MKKKLIILIIFFVVFLFGVIFYLHYQIMNSRGSNNKVTQFLIEKGDRNKIIGEKLEQHGLISNKYYFYYYVWSNKISGNIIPNKYELSGKMTIPEIALTITKEKDKVIKVTFPEGWTSKQMANRLNVNGLSGKDFLEIIRNPGNFKNSYDFLNDPEIKTMEGYLFPDTYFYADDSEPNSIVKKLLDNFKNKITQQMKDDIAQSEKKLHEIITMASIIEGEVRSDEDRRIVSGIFWNRLKNNQALESCATLAYVLGENKKQYSETDTKIDSPYNTYRNKGLPPGPISNPGLSAIKAAIYPIQTNYRYFLSDPETGKTVFSVTYEEHVKNKAIYGL